MILAFNKRARNEYTIQKKFQAGIVLIGSEVKSLRLKHASLIGSYVKIIDGETFLINAQITPYKFADNRDYDPKRTRKLLLKKKEIDQLVTYNDQKGWAIVPISIETVRRKIKLTLGVGKGKKQYEKREELKQRSIKRDIEREMKYR